VADEVNLQFVMTGLPAQVMADWRANPPAPFGDFDLVDESVESLTYEQHYYDWPQKIMFVATLGFALLFKGFMRSVFRMTVRFDPEGTSRTKATIIGKAHPKTRLVLGQLAAEHGGPVGLRVGV
jgi:hypothetical protein